MTKALVDRIHISYFVSGVNSLFDRSCYKKSKPSTAIAYISFNQLGTVILLMHSLATSRILYHDLLLVEYKCRLFL